MATRTPMMEQYMRVKQSCPDALLLFRLGDFYELFMDDAHVASQLLGLTLTGRGTGAQRTPMCGVPYHSADTYIGRLVGAGYKVAICEQTEDPKMAKGLVKREITRIVTPGTGYDFVREGDARLLIASAHQVPAVDASLTVAVMDPMTGDVWIKNGDADALHNWLKTMRVSEIVASSCADASVARWLEGVAQSVSCVFSPFSEGVEAIADASGDDWRCAQRVLQRYLRYTGKRDLAHIKDPLQVEGSAFLQLTASALTSLELLSPVVAGRRGATLLEVLDFTESAMGKRKLREMIERPFATLPPIHARQEAVAWLVQDSLAADELRAHIHGLHDLARIVSRISYGSAVPRDLVHLAAGLRTAEAVRAFLTKAAAPGELVAVVTHLHKLGDLAAHIAATLVDDPAGAGREGGILRQGVDETVDHLRGIAQGGRAYLTSLEQAERARTGIKSLKIAYNKVFGYYIEVTSANAHLVPPNYERKQTLVGGERFVTPELRRYEQEILEADDRVKSIEWDHFSRLLDTAAGQLRRIQETADALGQLDALLSLSECARRNHHVRPIVEKSTDLAITTGRHPVVEQHVDGTYVPNDTNLVGGERLIGLITGPNMAGKSTYMRQVALIVVLAQMGAFVPAEAARIGVVDRLFTRVGASDDVSGGMSTFMVEMTEAAEILRDATANSLILLDEIGRGTSTYDGMSIAEAIVEHLHDHTGARTLFATHYHELTTLPERLGKVFNLSVAVSEHGDQVVFLHRIVERPADRSYGIQVARHAGLPPSVTDRAKAILRHLERQEHADVVYEQVAAAFADMDEEKPVERAVMQELLALALDDMTPREALRTLCELQERLRK